MNDSRLDKIKAKCEDGSLIRRIDVKYLLEQLAEREKGCVWCKEDNKAFHDGRHFHFFCSYCGKRLEVKHE